MSVLAFPYRAALPAFFVMWLGGAGIVAAQSGAAPDAVSLHLGGKASIAVLANDSGNPNPATVVVVQPPSRGTAVVQANGHILYTHTGTDLTGDAFTYRASGDGGLSNAATVAITVTTARIPNPDLNVPPEPPPTAYQTPNAFSNLTFTQPVCLASPPGDPKRLFVCEKTGLLRVIPDVTVASPTAPTFLDLPALLNSRGESLLSANVSGGEQGLLGLAFHPNYTANRQFFIFYSVLIGGYG